MVHEYWTMPLLGPLCFIAASSCIDWNQKTKDRIIVACASIMVIWALILLPLTDMDYSAGPIEEVDGIAELFGDDSKLMISYELISGGRSGSKSTYWRLDSYIFDYTRYRIR